MKTPTWSTPKRWTQNLAAGCAIALMVTVSACSGTTGQPALDKTLTVVSAADAAPNQVFGQSQWFVPVLEPLVRAATNSRDPQPVLADTWHVSEDLTKVEFKLKQNVKFHDGRPLTAEDVVFSLKQAALPQNNSKAFAVAAKVTDVAATDASTVSVTFSSPTANMWDLFFQTFIFDKNTYSGIADGSAVNGTGPYKWESWKPGNELKLKKNSDYRDAANVSYEDIDVVVVTDATAQQSALRSGRADMAFGMATQDATLLGKDPKFDTVEVASMSVGMGMNVTAYPFDNKLARQAVGYAIDRKRLIEQAGSGLGEAAATWWDKDEPGWDETLNSQYSYDPEKAKKLVQEAGVAGAEVPLIFPTSALYMSFYEIIASGLEQAGFKPKAVQIEGNDAVSRLLRGDLGPSYLFYDATDVSTPATLMASTPVFSSTPTSPQHFSDPKYDELRLTVEQASPEAAPKALQEITKYLLDVSFNHSLVKVPVLVVKDSKIDTSGTGINQVFTNSGSLTGLGLKPGE